MVDLDLIRKRKAKKIVAIVGAACGAVALVIGALSLLWKHSGPLTVVLNNSGTDLSLARFNDDSSGTSYLLTDSIPDFTEVSGLALRTVPDEDIDKEGVISDISDNAKKRTTKFFKSAFYVRNNGDKAADYELSFDIDRHRRAANSFDLAKVLRVRLYENSDLSKHEYVTYAYSEPKYDPDENYLGEQGALVYGDVKMPEGIENNRAEQFYDNSTVTRRTIRNFAPNTVTRYTIVMWLEGNDIDSRGVNSNEVCSLSLGVNISAYEPKGETEPEDAQDAGKVSS